MPPESSELTARVTARLRAAGCVFAEEEAGLLVKAAGYPLAEEVLDGLVDRRVAGEPLETVLGWAEFAGGRIAVGPGVFVPRRRTAALVHAAVTRTRPGAVLVDLCCGSGAIARAITDRVFSIEVHATDIDPAAVACARRNLPPPAVVYQGDLFAPVPDRLRHGVDTVVANVPYVPSAEIAWMAPEARDHEPRVALDGGCDGLDVLRRVADQARDWLRPDGVLLIETSRAQADAARAAFVSAGLTATTVEHDDDLDAHVVVGVNPRPGRLRGPQQ